MNRSIILRPLAIVVVLALATVINRAGNTLSMLGANLGQAPQHQSTGVGAGPIVGTIGVGREPAAADIDKTTGRAFVVNRAGNTASVFDAATRAGLRTVAVGRGPSAVALSSGRRLNRAFVATTASDTVDVPRQRHHAHRPGLRPAGRGAGRRAGAATVKGYTTDSGARGRRARKGARR